ncbi:MAG: hypothetical protein QOI83_826 [Streptomycetaceae bacterium]|nr:hypothetical protein [Streptomycetaceae bacterium]
MTSHVVRGDGGATAKVVWAVMTECGGGMRWR